MALSILFLICWVVCSVQVSAKQQLSLFLSGPASLAGNRNLTVTATVKNTGHLKLKILNEPNSVLSSLPTNTFNISLRGCVVPFIGIVPNYIPQSIIKSNNASLFTFLKPGESISVKHNLNLAYNFTSINLSQPGAYHLVITPSNLDFLLAPNIGSSKLVVIRALFNPQTILRPFVVPSWGPFIRPPFGREIFVGCSAAQKTAIPNIASRAEALTTSAYNYLSSTTTATPRYTIWFGTYNSPRHDLVLSHFRSIHSNNFHQFTPGESLMTSSRWLPQNLGSFIHVIHLCPPFWKYAALTGTDSQPGILIHEASHFEKNGPTFDIAGGYGQDGSQALLPKARRDPNLACFNADSHKYFAENNPPVD
ncbi:peptidyl-Lys metalloendopeptidase [Flagelloscypha sp. PMI_526]|nr:peptidyl-Lys metalloendopeptidase [Flagelloscypha sp. PMI_526]